MKKYILSTVALACATALSAQTIDTKPTFLKVVQSDQSIVANLSDNGKWLLAQPASNETCAEANVYLYNVETGKSVVIYGEEALDEEDAIGIYHVSDVTDDGNIVVGSYSGEFSTEAGEYAGTPGYWVKSEKKWHAFETPSSTLTKEMTGSDLTFSYGVVSCVTPDGKYACGSVTYEGESVYSSPSYGVLWDLSTGKIITLSNLPTMTTESGCHFEAYTSMSADARYIAIYGDQSVQPTCFIYDRQKSTWFKFGKGLDNFLQMEGGAVISPNGKYAAGTIRTEDDGLFPVLYDLTKDEYVYYGNTDEENDLMVTSVDNDGNVYACSPFTSPSREFQILHNNIWYPFTSICELRYGIDFSEYTDYQNTGTPYNVSSDGRVIASMVYPYADSYVVTLPEDASTACEGVNLLSSYTVSPVDGSEFANVGTVSFTFQYDIKVLAGKTAAQLIDEDGNEVRKSMNIAVSAANSKTLIVTFRSFEMSAGKTYSLVLPAGSVALAKDNTKTNDKITVSYKGRSSSPVTVASVYPEDGSSIARLDNGTVYTILTMDTKVNVTSDAKANLYQVDGESLKLISSLNVVVSDDKVALYPSSTQYLYDGAEYKVVLSAGALTNAAGESSSANEEFIISYSGTYERQISTDDATLFSEDFSDISNALNSLMRYEGDHNTPTSAMQSWEFDTDNQPWNFSIRESSSSTDYCAASTSMYSPAGQSDDWMVIPQLAIPDESCYLTFKAQSYKDDELYTDVLNIVIWECDQNINTLDSATIAKMKAEGDIKSYTLTIGETEEGLDGEWTSYSIDLAAYSGKNIYIGFWNNNTNQSVLFVDDIVVKRNLKYLISLTNPSSVVNEKSINIAGSITINADETTYSSVKLTLLDSESNEISSYAQDGLSLTKGDKFAFSFPDALPLTTGISNAFSIKVQLDSYTDVTKSAIKCLAFEPVKRVVLEEMTGTTCSNCPLGILAIENLEKLYGENFIPISIHAYTGDQIGGSISTSYAQALGLSAAPTGIVQRSGTITSPMVSNKKGVYSFNKYSETDADTWADCVQAEMEIPADIDVSVDDFTYSESDNKLNLVVNVRSAINLTNQYLSTLVVVLEDSIRSYQVSNVYTQTQDIFGEWGSGGKYGIALASGVYHSDVVKAAVGSSYTGTTGLGFPSTLKAGEDNTIDISFSYPDQVSRSRRGKIVVMIFDGNTEALINSVVAKFPTNSPGYDDKDTEALPEIDADEAFANTDVYSLSGIMIFRNASAEQIASLPRGLYVIGGRLYSAK